MIDYSPKRRSIGGLRLEAHKHASTRTPLQPVFIPERLVIAVDGQSTNGPRTACVSVGDRVARGQTLVIASPDGSQPAVHASTSGFVSALEKRLVPIGDRLAERTCAIIDTDGRDERLIGAKTGAWPGSRVAQLERIRAAGIVGLGGAAFPTAEKIESLGECRAVIINGAECEPYISCDDMLMRWSAAEIVAGGLILCDLSRAAECIIAIERDKPVALEAVKSAALASGDSRLRVAELPSIYPAGGERQLIELLTGEEIPSRGYPSDAGYLCQNVGTAYAVHRLVRFAEPLISRVVTIAGAGVTEPQNREVLIGTPIEELIAHCGGYTQQVARLIVGGSMMGVALPNDAVPVTKSTNCIIAASAEDLGRQLAEWPCIRCGECSAVCPARLMPQELLRAARAEDHATLAALGLDDCIECGCCDVVCPSYIRLTETFRGAKRQIAKQRATDARAENAQRRFETRASREQIRAEEGERQHARLIESLGTDDDRRSHTIAAAVERARKKRPKPSESQ
jgi:electron transport complex protein RnfC